MTVARGVRPSVVLAMAMAVPFAPSGCARTPKAPPDPASDTRALRAARASDRCVDEAPSVTLGDGAIVHVALAASGAYGATRSGRVRAWDLKAAGVTVLELGRVDGLSPDGTTALTTEQVGDHGVRIERWDLATNRRLGVTTLEHGLGMDPPFTLAGRTALMRQASPPCDADCQTWGWRPPPDEVITWDLTAGKTGWLSQSCGGVATLSLDGLRVACVQQRDGVMTWTDLTRGGVSFHRPAPEWWPPPRAEPEEKRCWAPICERESPVILAIDSVQLAANGREVYYTYRGLALDSIIEWNLPPRHGWRLERWTPDPSGKGNGKVDRLAQSSDTLCARLLAVSAGGSVAVLGGDRYRTTIRRAPRYEGAPLTGAPPTLAAVISADGARILTGHTDGRMRLWDARTLALLVTSDP